MKGFMKYFGDISLPDEDVLDNASKNGLIIGAHSFKEVLEGEFKMSVQDFNVAASIDTTDDVSVIIKVNHNYSINISTEIRETFNKCVSPKAKLVGYECIDEEQGTYEVVFNIPVHKPKLSLLF